MINLKAEITKENANELERLIELLTEQFNCVIENDKKNEYGARELSFSIANKSIKYDDDILKIIVANLSTLVSEVSINTWIKNLKVEAAENTITLIASNTFNVDVLEKRYLGLIKTILRREYHENIEVKVKVDNK